MRVVNQELWNDLKWRKQIKGFNHRYMWLYLLTCPMSKACGIFYLPIDTIQIETKLGEEEITQMIKDFKGWGMLDYNFETEEILIFNYPKYNIIRLGKPMLDCLIKELSLVKDTSLIQRMVKFIETYIEKRPNDRKVDILKKVLELYKNILNTNTTNTTNTTTNNESWHDSYNDTENDEFDWEKLVKEIDG